MEKNKIIKINSLAKELSGVSINNDKQLLKLISNFTNLPTNPTLDELSTLATKSRQILQHSGKLFQMKSFTDQAKIEETLQMFQNVLVNKKWEEPYMEVSLLLEWAMYRAFAAIGASIPDEYGPILNSDGTAPIFTAGGKRPDLVAEFEDFVLVIESTITSGSRQYNTETEPVTRHIAEIQNKYAEKKVFSFFVAREIDLNVIEYFLVYYAFHKHPASKQHQIIIPITLSTFIEIFSKIKDKKPSKLLKNFFEEIETQRNNYQCNKCTVSKLDVDSFMKLIGTALTNNL